LYNETGQMIIIITATNTMAKVMRVDFFIFFKI